MPPSVDLRHCLELKHHRSASSPWPYRTVSRVPWPMWDIDTLRWWQRDTNQSKTQALNAQRITWCSDIMVMWSLVHLYCPSSFLPMTLFLHANAEFTLLDFSPDFHSQTGFVTPTNARNQRQISARSHEWQSRSVNYQRRDLRVSPTRWKYYAC